MYKNITLYLNTLNIYINKNKYIDIQSGVGWGKQNPFSSHHLPEIDLCRTELVK